MKRAAAQKAQKRSRLTERTSDWDGRSSRKKVGRKNEVEVIKNAAGERRTLEGEGYTSTGGRLARKAG